MTRLSVAAYPDGDVFIARHELDAFRAELRGAVLLPGEPGYDDARTIYNAMIDRRPAIIVRAAGVADVIAGVKFAASRKLLMSVRGGGHNVAGNAVCDAGLMLDLSSMRSVRVDPRARRAWAEGGATWGDFDAETQAFGLATTGGLISDTGVAGLTLGGGIGWLQGEYGLACDNVVSFELVSADGELIRASADENPELFWGLRGGGGNFGVVVSFEFALHPVGPLFAGMLVYPLEKATETLAHFRDFMATSPDRMGALAGLTTSADGEPVLVLVLVYNGPLDEGARVVEPLRRFGSPLVDTLGSMPYRQVQTLFDAGAPPGLRNYWKSCFLESLPDEAIDTLVARRLAMPAANSKLFIESFGGAMSRVGRDETVFDHREAPHNLLIMGAWPDPEGDEAHIAWARETFDAMAPFASKGVYMNYLGQEADEGLSRIHAAYGPQKLQRLTALKDRYDPHNFFRMNQNIPPSGT